MAGEERSAQRPTRYTYVRYGAFALLVPPLLAGLAVIAINSLRAAPSEGYSLRASTMIPASFTPATADCPVGPAIPPVEYQPNGGLADELALYSDELIAVRITLAPFGGPVPAEVRFDASWPTTVVDESGPQCAFVLRSDGVAPDLSWETNGAASASFRLAGHRRLEPTVIEVWLTAVEPVRGEALVTTLATDQVGDQFVIDPIGGRIAIDRRLGTAADVRITAVESDPPIGEIEVSAVVSNDDPTTRSFDVSLLLESSDIESWTIDADVECQTLDEVTCEVGEVMGGESVVINAVGTLRPGWSPGIPSPCGSSAIALTGGACLTATVESETGQATVARTAQTLVPIARVQDSPFVITTVPGRIVARAGQPIEVSFLFTSAVDDDLASVEISGSDCEVVARGVHTADDGDAVLERGETWQYDCLLKPTPAGTFRMDAEAIVGASERVTSSFSGFVEIVEPQMRLAVEEGSDPRVTLINVGRGYLSNVALRWPGCPEVVVIDGSTDRIEETEQVAFRCLGGVDLDAGVVGYATDATGQALVASS